MPEHDQSPPPISLMLDRKEAALLLNLLCDNARAWNGRIIRQLAQVVTSTDAFNAKRELQGRTD